MKTTIIKPQIRRGRPEINVPNSGGFITFLYDKYGPDTYANVQNSIEQEGLEAPTIAQTTSLLHQMYYSELKDTKEAKDVRELMKRNWLWGFTGTLYIPNKGSYVQDHPEVRDGMPFMDESELIRKLGANDPSVRFVPFGFKTGEMCPLELSKNPYVIALAGQEGANQLADITNTFKSKPYLWSFDSIDQLTTRVSALSSSWDVLSLDVYGDVLGFGRVGCAFGVLKNTGEASRAGEQ